MIYRAFVFCSLFLSFVGFGVGCSSGDKAQTATGQSEPLKRLNVSNAPPQTIDQHQATGTPGLRVIEALTENLVKANYKAGTIEPAMAERWEASADGLKYTFYLRRGLKWSNGAPLTAKDVVYSWRRALAPALGNQYAQNYYAIEGAEAYNRGKDADFSKVGVKALDETTVEFTFRRHDPIFLKRLTESTTAPVHQATVEAHGAFDDPTNTWIRAGNHVGNGPFMLVEWELNKILKVKKNPYYWNASAVWLEEIFFHPAETEMIEERLFRTGVTDLQLGTRVPGIKKAYYEKERPGELIDQPAYATYFYLFNTTKAPFDDINVRRAFTYAIDRQLITDRVTKNNEQPAFALSPSSAQYTPPAVNMFDPEKAKQFLAEAGYPNGKGFPTVTLTYNTMDTHRKIAIAIQQMWKNVLNVDAVIENQEWKVFLNHRQNLEHQIARAGSLSSLLDPSDFLESYVTGHGMNDTGWSNAKYDALIKKASSEVDNKKRMEFLYQAEAVLIEELPILPLYYYKYNHLISPKVKGVEFNAAAHFDYVPIKIINTAK